MKSRITVAIISAVLLTAAGTVNADQGRRGHYGSHHGISHSYESTRHYRGQRNYRSRNHYRPRHRGHYGHDYRHHGRHELRKGLKIAAGALLLGTVIHAATDHRRDRVIVHRRAAPQRRHSGQYRLDADGQCYDVSYNRNGEEVWTWVDSSYCY